MRTIITISEEDKKWLDSYSRTHKLSRAEVVRNALKEYIQHHQKDSYQKAIEKVFGIWNGRNGDALEYVSKLRQDRNYEQPFTAD